MSKFVEGMLADELAILKLDMEDNQPPVNHVFIIARQWAPNGALEYLLSLTNMDPWRPCKTTTALSLAKGFSSLSVAVSFAQFIQRASIDTPPCEIRTRRMNPREMVNPEPRWIRVRELKAKREAGSIRENKKAWWMGADFSTASMTKALG